MNRGYPGTWYVTSQINLFFIKVRTEGQEKIGNLLRPSKHKTIIDLVMLPILVKLRQKFGTRDFIYSRDLTIKKFLHRGGIEYSRKIRNYSNINTIIT